MNLFPESQSPKKLRKEDFNLKASQGYRTDPLLGGEGKLEVWPSGGVRGGGLEVWPCGGVRAGGLEVWPCGRMLG